jgi:hypothetical protein
VQHEAGGRDGDEFEPEAKAVQRRGLQKAGDGAAGVKDKETVLLSLAGFRVEEPQRHTFACRHLDEVLRIDKH